MKVTKQTNDKGKAEVLITLSPDDAGLFQSMAIQFAENIANCKAHQAKARRFAKLTDKVL